MKNIRNNIRKTLNKSMAIAAIAASASGAAAGISMQVFAADTDVQSYKSFDRQSEPLTNTNGKTVYDAIDWIKSTEGKFIDEDGYGVGGQNYQCADLIIAYYKFLGQKKPIGNAKDYVSNELPAGWQRIKDGEARAGDIIIYDQGYPQGGKNYGHIGLMGVNGVSYHENWSFTDPSVKAVPYQYNTLSAPMHYWGLIRPDFPEHFKDVTNRNSPFYTPIYWAMDNEITTGIERYRFGTDQGCTRGQAVTFLWRLAGKPEPRSNNPFKDVKSGTVFYKAILWAAENGITTGFEDGTFRQDATCTRGQIVTFLNRWRENAEHALPDNVFKDVKEENNAFYNAIQWANERGITTGFDDGTFRQDATCTRGQIVTFLYREETTEYSYYTIDTETRKYHEMWGCTEVYEIEDAILQQKIDDELEEELKRIEEEERLEREKLKAEEEARRQAAIAAGEEIEETETTEPETEPTTAPEQEAPDKVRIDENRLRSFEGTKSALAAQGFKPCELCHPE